MPRLRRSSPLYQRATTNQGDRLDVLQVLDAMTRLFGDLYLQKLWSHLFFVVTKVVIHHTQNSVFHTMTKQTDVHYHYIKGQL
jgi:hypothetical protein